MTCKCCSKEVQHLASTRLNHYTICWDCIIELDINGKNLDKYKEKA